MWSIGMIIRYIYYTITIREVPPGFHERMMKTVEMCRNQERIRQAWEEALNEKTDETNEQEKS